MSKLERELAQKSEELNRMSVKIQKRISELPSGTLRVSNCRGKATYYKSDGVKQTYLKKSELSHAADLAEREYLEKLLAELNCEKEAILRFCRNYHPSEAEDIYSNQVDSRKELVHPLILPKELYADIWYREKTAAKQSHLHPLLVPRDQMTVKNEYVRSKSEKIIADALSRNNVPYVYEAPLFLSGKKLYPDFTILNVEERKTLYWEHFGMLDDEMYLSDVIEKLNLYILSGIMPGDQLIITYESSKKAMKSRIVDEMIRFYC
ncbi:MAG: hypothetical protein IK088_07240 [Lachnospiraceae bacterium]|nr:hypothetical protein [Lachnospiraceae bacterium]